MAELLFIGDSLIAGYDWQSHIPFHNIHNISVPGAQVQDVLATVENIDVSAQPDLIHLCIGTNNIYKNDFLFLDSFRQLIRILRQNYPITEIMVSNIFPMKIRHIRPKQIVQTNLYIAEIIVQTGNCLLDMHKVFSEYSCESIFLEDKIHLTEQAYALWTRNIVEHIAFLIEPD